MITVVQRVRRASVHVDGAPVSTIGPGALLLLGVEAGDTDADADATAGKVARLRFFPGSTPMDRTLADVGGACLVVSQFTLAGALAKGNRPSFTTAAAPAEAERLYLRAVDALRELGLTVETGRFGAAMQVELLNDGPVTFVLRVRGGRVQ
ncbi:MAG: D-aminoacyl-tRNA deacylase [Planctomycetota bacterium]